MSALVAICVTITLVPYHPVWSHCNSLEDKLPDLQLGWQWLEWMIGCCCSSPNSDHQGDMPHSRCYSWHYSCGFIVVTTAGECCLLDANITPLLQCTVKSLIQVTPNPKLKCFSTRLTVVFALYIEAKCSVENEDVVGAALTGDAPTTSEWPTISLPIKVRLILETWRYV